MATEDLFFIPFIDITKRREERTHLIEEAKKLPAAVFHYEKLVFLWIENPAARETAKRMIKERQKIMVVEGQEGLLGFLLVPREKGEEIF